MTNDRRRRRDGEVVGLAILGLGAAALAAWWLSARKKEEETGAAGVGIAVVQGRTDLRPGDLIEFSGSMTYAGSPLGGAVAYTLVATSSDSTRFAPGARYPLIVDAAGQFRFSTVVPLSWVGLSFSLAVEYDGDAVRGIPAAGSKAFGYTISAPATCAAIGGSCTTVDQCVARGGTGYSSADCSTVCCVGGTGGGVTTGIIVAGSVRDGLSSQVVPNATVKITNQSTGVPYSVRSNSSGAYQITIPPGSYKMEVTARGFDTYRSPPLQWSAPSNRWDPLLAPLASWYQAERFAQIRGDLPAGGRRVRGIVISARGSGPACVWRGLNLDCATQAQIALVDEVGTKFWTRQSDYFRPDGYLPTGQWALNVSDVNAWGWVLDVSYTGPSCAPGSNCGGYPGWLWDARVDVDARV